MSEASSSDGKKPMEQPELNPSQVVEQLSVTTDDSNETSTAPKNLSDMPIDVVGLIVEKSDYKRQLILRKVSKSLRALVDNQKPACKSIRIIFFPEGVHIAFDDHLVIYSEELFDYGEDVLANPDDYPDAEDDDDREKVVGTDYKKVALDALASTLKNPKLQLEEFSFSLINSGEKDVEKYNEGIRNVLESLNHQVSVKKFKLNVQSSSTLLSILPCLKSGFLEKISLSLVCYRVNWIIDPTAMDQVALLKQWKQAEELELQYCIDRFPMEYTTHFKRFRFEEFITNGDRFARIKNFLSQLDNFEHCTLSYYTLSSNPNFVYELLGEPVFRSFMEEIFHHPIPNSDYYLELKKTNDFESEFNEKIEIKKKKRENN